MLLNSIWQESRNSNANEWAHSGVRAECLVTCNDAKLQLVCCLSCPPVNRVCRSCSNSRQTSHAVYNYGWLEYCFSSRRCVDIGQAWPISQAIVSLIEYTAASVCMLTIRSSEELESHVFLFWRSTGQSHRAEKWTNVVIEACVLGLLVHRRRWLDFFVQRFNIVLSRLLRISFTSVSIQSCRLCRCLF